MESVAPVGAMYQAGTLSGNPLATAAGLATLRTLREPGAFDRAESLAGRLATGLESAAGSAGLRLQTAHVGTILGFYFIRDDAPPTAAIHDYETARRYADTDRYARFFHALLERGVYFAPSQFEAAFLSTVHTEADIDRTLAAAAEAMQTVRPLASRPSPPNRSRDRPLFLPSIMPIASPRSRLSRRRLLAGAFAALAAPALAACAGGRADLQARCGYRVHLGGLHHPRAIAFAPDGRLFLAEAGSALSDGRVTSIDAAGINHRPPLRPAPLPLSLRRR